MHCYVACASFLATICAPRDQQDFSRQHAHDSNATISCHCPNDSEEQRTNPLAEMLERPVNHIKLLESWPLSSHERLGNDICLQRLPDLHPACWLCKLKGTLVPAEHVCRGRSSLAKTSRREAEVRCDAFKARTYGTGPVASRRSSMTPSMTPS